MGAFKNKAKKWWVGQFRYQGKKYKKEGLKTRKEAEMWVVQKKEELMNPQIETLTIFFQELATKYLTHCKQRMQKNTWRQKSFVFRSFLNYHGTDFAVNEIQKGMATDYLSERAGSCGNKAANRDLRDLC